MKNNHTILEVKNLTVKVKKRIILENIKLKIKKGEVHALVGPNGHGKSTLLLSLLNHFAYDISAEILNFNHKNIKNMEVDEIAKLGIFLAFQNPLPIPGLKTIDFLKAIINSHREKPIGAAQYFLMAQKNIKKLALNKDIIEREVNVNFSGGEKKKNEILQMLMLENKLVLLDEIDSGLDVDNINEIIKIVNQHHKTTSTSYLIVSHYDKMFLTMDVDYTHLIYNKQLISTKGDALIKDIHKYGYRKVIEKLGIPFDIYENEEESKNILGSCAAKKEV